MSFKITEPSVSVPSVLNRGSTTMVTFSNVKTRSHIRSSCCFLWDIWYLPIDTTSEVSIPEVQHLAAFKNPIYRIFLQYSKVKAFVKFRFDIFIKYPPLWGCWNAVIVGYSLFGCKGKYIFILCDSQIFSVPSSKGTHCISWQISTKCTVILHNTCSSHVTVLLFHHSTAKLQRYVSLFPISWQTPCVKRKIFRFFINAAHRIVMQCVTIMPLAYLSRCRGENSFEKQKCLCSSHSAAWQNYVCNRISNMLLQKHSANCWKTSAKR